MPKKIYADYVIYENSQIKAVDIYMVPLYIYSRLLFIIYGLCICIHSDLEACTQSAAKAYVYIYVYIHA